MNIGIAGVGGIGSNVALNLVRSGVTTLTIVDFDRVDTSNLNRQFYFLDQIGKLKVAMLEENLSRINPGIEIISSAEHITGENIAQLFKECDIIVEGFDTPKDKKMLLEHFGTQNCLIVSASGIAGSALDRIQAKKLGNAFIVGDFLTDCNQVPLYSHKVLAVAAKMTEIILSHTTSQS